MSESKHTPGPWRVDEDTRPGMAWNRHIYGPDGNAVCFMAHSDGKDVERDEANAALIARAPDLAAEVERLRERVAAADAVGVRQENILIKLEERLAAERRKVEALEAAADDDEATRTMMADILKRTAVALRGPEPDGGRYGWADLPERAAAAIAAVDVMQRAAAENGRKVEALREALRFYAQREHFALSDADAWDTVSGEPTNFWCDDAGTATVEDGSIARAALAASDPQKGGA